MCLLRHPPCKQVLIIFGPWVLRPCLIVSYLPAHKRCEILVLRHHKSQEVGVSKHGFVAGVIFIAVVERELTLEHDTHIYKVVLDFEMANEQFREGVYCQVLGVGTGE